MDQKDRNINTEPKLRYTPSICDWLCLSSLGPLALHGTGGPSLRGACMGCKICDDLNRKRREAVSNQRVAQDVYAAATNQDEREAALVALAKALRDALSLRQSLEEHKKQGCPATA